MPTYYLMGVALLILEELCCHVTSNQALKSNIGLVKYCIICIIRENDQQLCIYVLDKVSCHLVVSELPRVFIDQRILCIKMF